MADSLQTHQATPDYEIDRSAHELEEALLLRVFEDGTNYVMLCLKILLEVYMGNELVLFFFFFKKKKKTNSSRFIDVVNVLD
jgi:hypothetical protein